MAAVMIACKLPAGLTLEVDGVKKKINGYLRRLEPKGELYVEIH